MTTVHRIGGLIASSYLIESGVGLYLFDGGFTGHGGNVLRRIAQLGRSQDEIRLAMVSHGHIDHFGGLAELQARASFPVLVHPAHAENLRSGLHPAISPGIFAWSRGYERLANRVVPRMRPRRLDDVIETSDGMRLDEFGLRGRVVFLSGHSAGDQALVLDEGQAFVGDVIQGPRAPLRLPELTAMAFDTDEVLASWHALLDLGMTEVYPAHGAITDAEAVRLALRRYEARGHTESTNSAG